MLPILSEWRGTYYRRHLVNVWAMHLRIRKLSNATLRLQIFWKLYRALDSLQLHQMKTASKVYFTAPTKDASSAPRTTCRNANLSSHQTALSGGPNATLPAIASTLFTFWNVITAMRLPNWGKPIIFANEPIIISVVVETGRGLMFLITTCSIAVDQRDSRPVNLFFCSFV